MAVLVAVLGATAAAWWPGRAVARAPGHCSPSRRDRHGRSPHTTRRSRPPLLIAVGDRLSRACPTGTARRSSSPGSWRRSSARCSSAHWRSASSPGRPGTSPSPPRLALRDLARYQARSGAALAAITLALGIAAAVVITAAAEEKQEDERAAAALPNLSDRQIRVYTGRRETRSSSRSRSRRPPSSHGALRASASSPQASIRQP